MADIVRALQAVAITCVKTDQQQGLIHAFPLTNIVKCPIWSGGALYSSSPGLHVLSKMINYSMYYAETECSAERVPSKRHQTNPSTWGEQ